MWAFTASSSASESFSARSCALFAASPRASYLAYSGASCSEADTRALLSPSQHAYVSSSPKTLRERKRKRPK